MSVRLMAMVFASKLTPMKVEKRTVTVPVLKLMLLALTDHASDDGVAVYPSQALVMRKTGLSHGGVNNALRALTAEGFILPVGKMGDGRVNYTIGVSRLKSTCLPGEQAITPPGHPVDTPCLPGGHPPGHPVDTNHQENHQPTTKQSSNPSQVEEEIIPKTLDTPAFKTLWSEWKVYRKEIGKVKNWPGLWKRQLSMLAEWGGAGAIESVRTSMCNGWTGLFAPKTMQYSQKSKAPTGPRLSKLDDEMRRGA